MFVPTTAGTSRFLVKVDKSSPGTGLLQHLASGKGAESGIRGDHVGNFFCGDSQLDESSQHLHNSPNGRTTLAGSEEAVSGDCCEASTPRNLAGGSGGFFCAPPVGLTIEELWLACQSKGVHINTTLMHACICAYTYTTLNTAYIYT